MKNRILLGMSMLVAATMMMACGSDDAADDSSGEVTITLSQQDVAATAEGGTFTVHVTCTGREWTAFTSDDWMRVSVSGSTAQTGTVTITVNANNGEARTGVVTVKSGLVREVITVAQAAVVVVPIDDEDIEAPEGYRLVWHDEFDEGTTLGGDWTHEVQNAYWVNNELQNYRSGTADGQRVTELVNGELHINCFRGSDGKIYSGRVYAKVNTGWKYGYFEARIQLPQGKGTWPAFWMMPVNNNFATNPWPGCGEIDIMEEVGADPGDVSATIHCNKYNNGGTSVEHGGTHFSDAESAFHVYACEWTADEIRFLFDGRQVLRYRNDGSGKDAWPFNVAFYPILNLAWGGDWGGYKGVDESALPCALRVDYVRVFQK
ncbi:MAG: family 16 glycosylhydrolase [Prevotella sp.]|nr:family 16 glycosylhydrolase [Prevotella sp.]